MPVMSFFGDMRNILNYGRIIIIIPRNASIHTLSSIHSILIPQYFAVMKIFSAITPINNWFFFNQIWAGCTLELSLT